MPLPAASQPPRGYLANISTLPPLIYPFQYNPQQLTDSKQISWGKRTPIVDNGTGGLGLGAATSFSSDSSSVSFSGSAGLGGGISPSTVGRLFSSAELKQFESEGDRTISFDFEIDGRDDRPGEPSRRREDGDILGDLAILRSFVYPELVDLTEMFGLLTSSGCERWSKLWGKEPPTALLILGDLVVEGYITNLQITETLFNANLDPVRAEVSLSLIEKVDSYSFVLDAVKRVGRVLYHSAYEDIGKISSQKL